MSAPLRILLAVVAWLATVTLLHLWLNTKTLDRILAGPPPAGTKFRVGFLPVT